MMTVASVWLCEYSICFTRRGGRFRIDCFLILGRGLMKWLLAIGSQPRVGDYGPALVVGLECLVVFLRVTERMGWVGPPHVQALRGWSLNVSFTAAVWLLLFWRFRWMHHSLARSAHALLLSSWFWDWIDFRLDVNSRIGFLTLPF